MADVAFTGAPGRLLLLLLIGFVEQYDESVEEENISLRIAMGANRIEILPVVNRADMHKLEGILTLRDVLDAYGVSARDGA